MRRLAWEYDRILEGNFHRETVQIHTSPTGLLQT
jgi:hypothetical protein